MQISYALYCLHTPLFNWIAWMAAWKGVSAAAVPTVDKDGAWFFFRVWAIAPVLALCIVASALAYRLVEAPARAAINRSALARQRHGGAPEARASNPAGQASERRAVEAVA